MVGSRETTFLSMLILFNVFIFMAQLAIVVFAISVVKFSILNTSKKIATVYVMQVFVARVF